jgi:hypothetical protein
MPLGTMCLSCWPFCLPVGQAGRIPAVLGVSAPGAVADSAVADSAVAEAVALVVAVPAEAGEEGLGVGTISDVDEPLQDHISYAAHGSGTIRLHRG